VAVLWVSIGTGMARTGLGFSDPDPLSYLGTDARSRTLFRAGLLVAAVLLAAFAAFVHQRRSTPRCFLVAFLIGLGGQVVAAIVPLSGRGASPAVHTTGGLVLGISLPILMGCFAAGQPAGPWRRLSRALFWLEAAACVAGVVLSQSMRAPIAEALPAGAFHLWVVVVAVHVGRSDGRVR
jgi:heme A synthase